MSEKNFELDDSLNPNVNDENSGSLVSWIIAAVLIVAGIVFVPMLVNMLF